MCRVDYLKMRLIVIEYCVSLSHPSILKVHHQNGNYKINHDCAGNQNIKFGESKKYYGKISDFFRLN